MWFLWDVFSMMIAVLGWGIKYFCLVILWWVDLHSGCYDHWWIPSDFRWVFFQVFLVPVGNLSRLGLNNIGPCSAHICMTNAELHLFVSLLCILTCCYIWISGRSFACWSSYAFCPACLLYKRADISTFCTLWLVHFTGMLRTNFLLSNSSPGDVTVWSIRVVRRHSSIMLMSQWLDLAFLMADFIDCMQHSTSPLDCGYFGDDQIPTLLQTA